ncbi:MAG: S1/P1 Nuclease [Bacteroidetes bacterium]|nr:S1/P1 Nuclease [Bacteroidota bacterium]
MKKILCLSLLLSVIVTFAAAPTPWGFWGHQRINKMALYTLPEDLFGFYKPYIEYITEHAVDPDKRRYAFKEEAPRHYIDVDHYGESPFPAIPRKWNDAVVKFSEDSLNAYGIVPWHIERMMFRLTKAFQDKDINYILKTSADLGHYVGDVHVPLHCTENYNGQKTNQVGIHGFWESRIPEMMGENFDYLTGKAEFIPDINAKVWEIVLKSHSMVDSVLGMEKQLNAEFPSDQKYSYETRGASTVRVYSKEYTEKYNDMLDNMVERRMRESIITLGSFYLTAWINAGKPNLTGIEVRAWTAEELKEMEELDNAFKKGEDKGTFKDDDH